LRQACRRAQAEEVPDEEAVHDRGRPISVMESPRPRVPSVRSATNQKIASAKLLTM
jgi:hypothetical protein